MTAATILWTPTNGSLLSTNWDANLKSVTTSAGATVVGGVTADTITVSGAALLNGGLTLGTPVSVTAGTTQTLAGAAALKPLSIVNAANANDGVALPTATGSGAPYLVITVGSTATPKVWPQAADKIDGGTAGAATTLTAAHRAAIFVDTSAGNWQSFLLGAAAT